MLALAKGDLEFGKSMIVDEHAERDDGLAGVLGCLGEFAQFALGKQELAVAENLMVGVAAELVLGYMHLLGVEFVAHKLAIRIRQTGFGLADGLDFRAEKLYAGCVALEYLVVEGGAFVLDIYCALKMQF